MNSRQTDSWLVLRAMTAMELRTLLRGRSQALGLLLTAVAIAVAILMLGRAFHSTGPVGPLLVAKMQQAAQAASAPVMSGGAGARPAPPAGPAHGWSPQTIMILRWIAIAVGGGIAAFLSIGYGTQAILAAFAGEKDARTLEVLLVSPIPDTRLFLLRCASVLLPTAVIGYLYLLIAAGLSAWSFRAILSQVPVHMLAWGLLAGLPVMLLINVLFVALGAAVSVRSDSLKGAGHLLGGVAFLIFFAVPYSIPLLSMYPPGRRALLAAGHAWLEMPFAVQYIIVLIVLAVPAAALLGLGRALFRRDRLLT